MATLSRRSFLAATSTAASAAAILPEAAIAITQPARLTDRDFYYLLDCPDRRVPDMHGTSKFPSAEEGSLVLRRRFRPRPTDARFRLIRMRWQIQQPELPHGYFRMFSKEQQAAWAVESDALGDKIDEEWNDLPGHYPESYVQLPPYLHQSGSRTPDPFVTRAEGLAQVAAVNRKTWDAIAIGDDYYGMLWEVLIEYGIADDRVPGRSHIKICEGGVGVDDYDVTIPVRVVVPTDAELDLYECAPGVERGIA